MGITRQALIEELSVSDSTFRNALKVCNLPLKQAEFDDEQAGKLREARQAIDAGQSLQEVAKKYGGKVPARRTKTEEALALVQSNTVASEASPSASQESASTESDSTQGVTLSQLRELSKQRNHPLGYEGTIVLMEACGLPELESLDPEQVAIFERGLAMLAANKTIDQIRAHFAPDARETFDLDRLVELSKQAGAGVTIREGVKILKVCGLSGDRDNYSAQERDLFLACCVQYKQNGVPLERCAAEAADLDDSIEKILQSNLQALNVLTQQKAQTVVASAVPMFASHLANELRSGTIIDQQLAEFERAVQRQLGKPQKSGIEIAREMGLLPDLTPPSDSLPPASETTLSVNSTAE